jgi:hypothetical protein
MQGGELRALLDLLDDFRRDEGRGGEETSAVYHPVAHRGHLRGIPHHTALRIEERLEDQFQTTAVVFYLLADAAHHSTRERDAGVRVAQLILDGGATAIED